MMALTQGNRDTNGYQILDVRLQILPQTSFRVAQQLLQTHPGLCQGNISARKRTCIYFYAFLCTYFFSVLYFCDRSEFLVLLEMQNSAGKVPFYLRVRMMGSLPLLLVPEVPTQ